MTYYVALPLLFLLGLIEAAVLPMFRISGLQPNLILVVLTAWITLRGISEALVLIPFTGVLLGLVGSAPLGAPILALAPLAILGDLRGSRLNEGGFTLAALYTVIMTIIYHLIFWLFAAAGGEAGSFTQALLRVIFPVTLLNLLILAPVYAVLWMSSHEVRRPSYV